MTIITAQTKEDLTKQTAEESLQDGITGTRVFNLYSDIVDESLGSVVAASPVALGDLFPGTLTAQCVSRIPARRSDTFSAFTLTLNYKSILNQIEQERIAFPNPLDRATKWVWTSRTVERAAVRLLLATNGSTKAYTLWNPATFTFGTEPYLVANTATDPFDPPLVEPVTEWIASFSKNVTTPPTWVETYNNAVNNADITVDGRAWKKGQAKMSDLRIGEKMKENGTVFRQVTGSIIFRPFRDKRTGETEAPEPWDEEVLNEGMRKWGTNKWVNIQAEGQAVSKPVPLDATGVEISPDGAPIPESSLYWMLFRRYPRKSFASLPL